ncbi:methyltransferase domain-containing protein [Bauldia sp.]|uniref:methyltransferase domain-containing protein n=1 Tax=Bauldia sp. TaxID=2575872 RepID=UPI003BA8602E
MPTDDISLHRFTAMDKAPDTSGYIRALEAFDAIPQLQELKAIERREVSPGNKLLDVGCGFGLETLRLARLVEPGGTVTGIDKSADFVAEAVRRAASENLSVSFEVGEAEQLPYPDATFDHVRAERLLIYLKDYAKAVGEMKRATKAGGRIAIIEPDFSTNTINLADRPVVRKALAHEADTAVVEGFLPGPLLETLRDLGLSDIRVNTRVLIYPPDLAATYFAGVGRHAAEAGVLTAAEGVTWTRDIATLHAADRLFGTIGYFLFTARV